MHPLPAGPRGGEQRAAQDEEESDEGGATHQEDRVHRVGRRHGGQERVPAGEGNRQGDVQDKGWESLGDGGAERGGASEEEVGLRGAGTGEDDRLLGDDHQRRERRWVGLGDVAEQEQFGGGTKEPGKLLMKVALNSGLVRLVYVDQGFSQEMEVFFRVIEFRGR